MRFAEIESAPQLSPEKARIAALQRQKDMAAATLKAERERQRLQKPKHKPATIKPIRAVGSSTQALRSRG